MGKNKKTSSSSGGLGRALIKDKKLQKKNRSYARRGNESVSNDKDEWIHSASQTNSGTDWARLNLRSVTEESNLDEFLRTAELAQEDYEQERQNIKIVNPDSVTGQLPTKLEESVIRQVENEHKQFLTIPRRPFWDENTSSDELRHKEQQEFLKWRKQLAILEEKEHLSLTPFEKNLDVWRQLWRVIERSEVVVQIVDARDPLLFYCADLSAYVTESNGNKVNVILVNKADLLTLEQRKSWAKYFREHDMSAVFWSALTQQELEKVEETSEHDEGNQNGDEDSDEDSETGDAATAKHQEKEECEEESEILDEQVIDEAEGETGSGKEGSNGNDPTPTASESTDEGNVHNVAELISWLKSQRRHVSGDPPAPVTVGMVGYPNVGKSSTINVLLGHKKVAVSATPGKTKHFQTLYIDDELCLCDCPGLVMPSFVTSKADMIVNSILPIDQMRDHSAPITLVCERIPRHVIEETYNITLPSPREGERSDREPTHLELCSYYAYTRGFMTSKGVPDCSRAARLILKDYVKGKLLYCKAPPSVEQSSYHVFEDKKCRKSQTDATYLAKSMKGLSTKDVDDQFFAKVKSEAHVKGESPTTSSSRLQQKPWKKHYNCKKKEKTRRLYSYLDI